MTTPEAGRELDALIAEQVMGWEWRRPVFLPRTGPRLKLLTHDSVDFADAPLEGDEVPAADAYRFVPRYSTDIAAAWLVVEKVRADGATIDIGTDVKVLGEPGWTVEIGMVHKMAKREIPGGDGHAETAPLAICRAALEAIAACAPLVHGSGQ